MMVGGLMRRKLAGGSATCVALALLLSSPAPLMAQHTGYELGPGDLAFFPTAGALALFGLWKEEHLEPISVEDLRGLDPGDLNRFDRVAARNWSPYWSRRSDISRVLVSGGAIALVASEGIEALRRGDEEGAFAVAALMGGTALVTAGVTYVTKVMVGRKRPYAYNTDLSLEERHRIAEKEGADAFLSFFSGHSSAAFAAAAFTSTVFEDSNGQSGWSRAVWGTTMSLAAFTAVARVKAGVHYPSDVLVGALVGTAIGHLVPAFHRRDKDVGPGGTSSRPLFLGLSIPVR